MWDQSYRPRRQTRRRTVAAWCRSSRTWSSCGGRTCPRRSAAPSRRRACGRRSTRRCRRCWRETLSWGSPVGTPNAISHFFFLFPFYANATQATSEDETSTHRDVWSENPGAHESRRQTATNELAQRYCYNHTTVSQYNQLDFVVKELRKTTTLMAPQTAVTHTSQLQGSGLKLG